MLGIIFSIVVRLHKKAEVNALVVLHLAVQQKSCSSEHGDQERHSKAYFRNQYVCRSALITKDRAELHNSCWDSCVLQGCSFPVALPGPLSVPCPLPFQYSSSLFSSVEFCQEHEGEPLPKVMPLPSLQFSRCELQTPEHPWVTQQPQTTSPYACCFWNNGMP